MSKLQYLTLATVISILGLNSIGILDPEASVARNTKDLTHNNENLTQSSARNHDSIYLAAQVTSYELAQKSTEKEKSSASDEDMEMIKTIQQRDKKLENLKELKQLQNKFNQEKLKSLAKEDIQVDNPEELQKIQEIINDESLNSDEIINALKKQNINIESIEKLNKIKKIVNAGKSSIEDSKDSGKLSATTAFRMFTIGIPATILVFFIAKPFAKGTFDVIISNYQKKFGKPPIPERSLKLHHEAFQEISRIARKVNSLNDDKFGNEEFKTLIHFKIDLAKGTEGYKDLNYKVELLRAAIIAQKSFLKLASTELRYRSRKQQEFYQYITDNLEEDIDKEAFTKKIKKKQTEILPLINTEEGREAIHSYAKEINEISKYELGLKLLALFRKYDLKDFSIIRDISGIVEGLQGSDLLEPKRLILTVKEYYDVFEKIAPILEISEAENNAATYARILQIVGLVHRHGDSYHKFKELIRLLHKWENPHETITMVREQYNAREYHLPFEFTVEIPGLSVHEKYATYLADLV